MSVDGEEWLMRSLERMNSSLWLTEKDEDQLVQKTWLVGSFSEKGMICHWDYLNWSVEDFKEGIKSDRGVGILEIGNIEELTLAAASDQFVSDKKFHCLKI